MGRARLYRVKDIRTGKYLQGVFRASQVQEICGMRCDVSGYARSGSAYDRRWKIEYAETDGEKDIAEPMGWETKWCSEWDRARMKLLKAGGKA